MTAPGEPTQPTPDPSRPQGAAGAPSPDGPPGPPAPRRISAGVSFASNRTSPSDRARLVERRVVKPTQHEDLPELHVDPTTKAVRSHQSSSLRVLDPLLRSAKGGEDVDDDLSRVMPAIKVAVHSPLLPLAEQFLGQRVGSYVLQGVLGAGTMGFVFTAADARNGRSVAVKLLAPGTGRVPEPLRRGQFQRETKAASRVAEHPHVVEVLEVGDEKGTLWYAMEYVPDGTLYEHVVAHGPLDQVLACTWFSQVADALAAVHRSQVYHRDVKPPNLMLRGSTLLLSDFGLAKILDPDDDFKWVTESVGSPMYAAPEITKDRSADERSDIYSLGATLFFALTGKHPYGGSSNKEIRAAHKTQPVPDPRVSRLELRPELCAVVRRCLAKEPMLRYANASEVSLVLRQLSNRLRALGVTG